MYKRQLQGWKDENGQEVNSGRMNLGVVTVNLPRIALEAEGDKDKFWSLFAERMEMCIRDRYSIDPWKQMNIINK